MAPQSLAGSRVSTIPSPPCTCQSEDDGRNKMLNEELPWLRLLTSTAGGTGSILGRGTKIPHASARNQKTPNGPSVLPPRAPRPLPHPIRSVAAPSLFPGVGNMAAFLQLMPGISPSCRKAWLAYKWTLAPFFSSQGLLWGLSGPTLRLEPWSAQSTCVLWSWFLISRHNKPGCLPPGSYLTRIPEHLRGKERVPAAMGGDTYGGGRALQTRQVCAINSLEAGSAGRAHGASWPLCQSSVNCESRRCGP